MSKGWKVNSGFQGEHVKNHALFTGTHEILVSELHTRVHKFN